MKFFVLILCVYVVWSQVEEDVPEDDVLVLTGETFNLALKEHPLLVVKFFAPWCGHCKSLAPEYAKAASALLKEDPPIVLAEINADDGDNKEVAKEFEIQGFPTVLYFFGTKTGKYEGSRTSDGMVSFFKKISGASYEHALDEEIVKQVIADVREVESVAIMGWGSRENMFKAVAELHVASQLNQKFRFTTPEISEAVLGVKGEDSDALLTLAVVRSFEGEDETVVAQFTDSMGWEQEAAEFIHQNSLPIVAELTADNARELVKGGLPLAVIFFEGESMAHEVANAVRPAAAAVVGQIRVILLNQQSFGPHQQRLGLKGSVPAMAIDNYGAGDRFPFEGDVYNTEEVAAFLTGFATGELAPLFLSADPPESQDSPVYVLVGKTFESDVAKSGKDVLVKFYTPSCGHCQRLAPTYEKLAVGFSNFETVRIAEMNAADNDVPRGIDIHGYPTVIMFPANGGEPVTYSGDRSLEDLRQFVLDNSVLTNDVDVEEVWISDEL